MAKFTNPWTWAAELIDRGFSVQDALRKVAALPDFMLDVASGNTEYSQMNKFGRNPTIASSSEEVIWDGSTTYTWPTSASIDTLWSAVDSVTTRGVDIEVQGLDTNWLPVTQTATTDGTDSTTEVTLTTALRRVFRLRVLDASVMDQIIRVGPAGKATFQAQITIGFNQTLMALYTIPANKTGYMTNYYASVNKVSGGGDPDVNMRLWMRDNTNGYAPQIKHIIGMNATGTTHFAHMFLPYLKVAPKTDCWLVAENLSGSAVADVDGGFDIILGP